MSKGECGNSGSARIDGWRPRHVSDDEHRSCAADSSQSQASGRGVEKARENKRREGERNLKQKAEQKPRLGHKVRRERAIDWQTLDVLLNHEADERKQREYPGAGGVWLIRADEDADCDPHERERQAKDQQVPGPEIAVAGLHQHPAALGRVRDHDPIRDDVGEHPPGAE